MLADTRVRCLQTRVLGACRHSCYVLADLRYIKSIFKIDHIENIYFFKFMDTFGLLLPCLQLELHKKALLKENNTLMSSLIYEYTH